MNINKKAIAFEVLLCTVVTAICYGFSIYVRFSNFGFRGFSSEMAAISLLGAFLTFKEKGVSDEDKLIRIKIYLVTTVINIIPLFIVVIANLIRLFNNGVKIW